MMGKHLMQKVRCEMLSLLIHILNRNVRKSGNDLRLYPTLDRPITRSNYGFHQLFLAKRFFTNSVEVFSPKKLSVRHIPIIFDCVESLPSVSYSNSLRVPANFLSHIFRFLSNRILDFHVVKWFSTCESKLIDHFFCQSYIQRPIRPMIDRCHN